MFPYENKIEPFEIGNHSFISHYVVKFQLNLYNFRIFYERH